MKKLDRRSARRRSAPGRLPAAAAAPPFDTPAPVAYMIDLSSGAVLYAKDADRRMPPASMAKMMTVYVAFDLIKKGELKLDQQFTVRPETWKQMAWPAAGSTMFLSAGEQVSVDNLLQGHRHAVGQRRLRRAGRGHFGHRAGVRRADERRGEEARPDQQPFRHVERLARRWRDLCHRARPRARSPRRRSATIPSSTSASTRCRTSPGARRWARARDITQANRDPLLGRVAGRRRAQDRPYRGSRLRLHRLGRAERPAAGDGGRRARPASTSAIEESVKFMDWGFRAWQAKPIVAKGKRGRDRRGPAGQRRAASGWSRRAIWR